MKKTLHLMLTFALATIFAVSAYAQPASGYYKIQNVGNGKYVEVTSPTYAMPRATVDDATVIYVGVGEEWTVGDDDLFEAGGTPDGSYKVTSLQGNGVQVYSYVNYAVSLAYAFIDVRLKDGSKVAHPLTDEEVELAKETIKYYADNEVFMRIKPDGSYVNAIATIPAIPDWVEEKAREHGVTDGAWNWAVRQVLSRLDRLGEFGIGGFKNLIANNLEKIQPGTTYYLTADEDNTFGYITAAEFNALTARKKAPARWKLEEVETFACAESGYYRIKNGAGFGGKQYVRVDGMYEAEPDATAEEALTDPGTVIYLGTEAMPGKTKVTALFAQTDDVIEYAKKAVRLAYDFALQAIEEYTENAQSENIQKVKDELPGIFKNYINTQYDLHGYLYLKPTITANREDAVYCMVTLPGMSTLDETVASIFGGTSGYTIAQDFPWAFRTNEGGAIIGLDTLGVWNFACDRLIEGLANRGSSQSIQNLVKNNIKNVVTGHTYVLAEDAQATFDYYDITRNYGLQGDAMLDSIGDIAKWVLEPIEGERALQAKMVASGVNPDDDQTYYYGTHYASFPVDIAEGMKAYTITGAEMNTENKYILTKSELPGTRIPANVPVLLESKSETGNVLTIYDDVVIVVDNDSIIPAPRRVVTKAQDGENLLVADHFNNTKDTRNMVLYGLSQDNYGPGFVSYTEAGLTGNVAMLDASTLPDTPDGYYIFATEVPETGIDALKTDNIKSVKYVSVAGVVSDSPFNGMNIVIATMTDGTVKAVKAVF